MNETPVAVVTGAARGIGEQIAARLLQSGSTVVVVDRDKDAIVGTADALGQGALPVGADVSDEADVARLAEEIETRLGRWDILVNNAGIYRTGGLETTSISAWDEVLAVCARGTWLCTRAATPLMRARAWGRVVNIASVVAHGADSTDALPYVVAKSAVLGFTRAAARELGGYGITVNAVSPGTVETSMLAAAVNADEIRASRSVLTLAGRLGHPYEIAAAVAYLVSEEAAFVTGQALVVDGGRIDKF